MPWERGFYVKAVVLLAEFLLAYKQMVSCVRFFDVGKKEDKILACNS